MKNVKNKITIGITGIVGSGKSTVTSIFKDLGYNTFSCDQYNHILLQESNNINIIKDKLNCPLINNKLNKEVLAEIVFNNPNKLKILNDILQPQILKGMLNFIDNNHISIIEIPLLFELNYQKYFDFIIVVVSDYDNINIRLKNRGWQKQRIQNTINNQLDQQTKIALSTDIIDNNNDLSQLINNVKGWINKNL